jgi:hypothetical protein
MSRKKKGADGKTDSKSPMSGPIPGMQGGRDALSPSMVDTTSKVDEAAKRRAMAASMGRPEMGGGDKSVMDSDKTAETTPRKTTSTTPRKIVPKKAPSRPAASTSTSKSFTPPADNATAPAAKSTAPAPKSAVFKPAEKSKKAESFDLKGTNKTVYGTDTTSVFQKRAAKEREEKKTKINTGPKRTRYAKNPVPDKTYADGGTTSSKPAPKKAPMPAFAREAKENRERDQRVKKEREEFDKGAPTRLKDQGSFKHGGMTASKRGDGIAMRGKTKGKMY